MDLIVPVVLVVLLCILGSVFPANHDIKFLR